MASLQCMKRLVRGVSTFKTSFTRNVSASTQSVTRTEEEINQENWKQRCELATAYRALEKYNLHEGVCNHLTARAPSLHQKENVILIIPYGMYWSQVTPQSLVGISLKDGSLVEGTDLPDLTAHSIHRGIYRHRPDVQSIMHTHALYSSVLSVLEDPEIKPIHQNSCRYTYNNVAYDKNYEEVAADGVTDESDRLGKAIGDKEILLMGNHGLTTTGDNVAVAFDRTYYFEIAARIQVEAYKTQKPMRYMSEGAQKSVEEFMIAGEKIYADAHFYALQKVLLKEDPTFFQQ